MTKITFILGNPTDEASLETEFVDKLKSLFISMPGYQKIEFSKVHPKEDGSPTPYWGSVDLYFESYEGACNAVKTPEAGALFPAVFGTGVEVKIAFSEVEA